MFKKMLFLLCCVVCVASCSSNSNNNSSLETTIAGNIEEQYLDGNAHFQISGVPFTEKEVSSLVATEMETGIIEEGCRISNNGYYHVNIEINCLNYGNLTLPITKNGELYGEMVLQRKNDGMTEVAKVSFYGEGHMLSELLESNPEKKFAMVYAGVSEYAILEDNTVYTISGYPPEIRNCQNLFNTYNLEDNILSYKMILE